jgi:hypothetical protein
VPLISRLSSPDAYGKRPGRYIRNSRIEAIVARNPIDAITVGRMMQALAAVSVVLLVGCAAPRPVTFGPPQASSEPRPPLVVSNMTTLTVTLVVNGQPVGTYPPGQSVPDVDVTMLPPLPWAVEARSSSGKVLTSMQVTLAEVQSVDPHAHTVAMGRVDLSCGRLTIFAGMAPSGPVPPSPPGSPGDCAP